jgi:molybdate-binding protein
LKIQNKLNQPENPPQITQIRDLQKGLIKMISRNGKGNRWFMKQHMQKIPKLVDSTLSKAGRK